ncbi:MAG: type 1 glutamine amidotransferase [Candidatus Kapabacteria bacterium]|nr:type 1 glutamine amidotransferase [Ignavibacteriota bacterium]MCW5885085.1 type 1 glutamine amidotransferase [Candidatus Kapabacteria bacterium]
MKLNIHYYQHVNYEGLAHIQKWCDTRGYNLTRTNFKSEEPIPNPDLYDVLIVLGGPMSVHDESKYPWLIKEKKSIDRALNDGRKVIGICLGAQLLAEVLGSEVKQSKEKEVGWLNIKMSDEYKNHQHFDTFPKEFQTFHWHGEEFTLPHNSIRIASSDTCENQIFLYGDIAAGFQCHPEQTEYSISRMLDRAGDYLKPGKYVQTREEIIREIHHAHLNNNLLSDFLDSFLKLE